MMSRFGYDVWKDIRKTNHDGGIRIWYVGLGGESIDKINDDGFIFSTTGNTIIKTDPNLSYLIFRFSDAIQNVKFKFSKNYIAKLIDNKLLV